MVDNCSKCGIKIYERELELSHDIPRWMGGTDLDGRHFLCKECHQIYENTILQRCLKLVGEIFNEEERIEWMKALSKELYLRTEFQIIARKVKEEFYG